MAKLALIIVLLVGVIATYGLRGAGGPSGASDGSARRAVTMVEGSGEDLVAVEPATTSNDDAPTVPGESSGEGQPAAKMSPLWSRRDLDERARSNIAARQPTVRDFLPYLTGKETYPRDEQYLNASVIASQYAIMVIYDAEGLSVDDGAARKSELREQGVQFHHIASGGKTYIIPHGDFPAYDAVKALQKEGGPVDLDALPHEDVIQLCERALRYRVQ